MPVENTPDDIITRERLQAILAHHGLGHLRTIERPPRGIINHTLILNHAYVIRFDTLSGKGQSRFESERLAYETLAGSAVPVPEVIALDDSKVVVPYDFLITRKLPGRPLIDLWADLDSHQREKIARQAGRYLALLHAHTFPAFGHLRKVKDGGFSRWFEHLHDFFRRYAAQALKLNALEMAIIDEAERVLLKYETALDRQGEGVLLHSDYHFENLLATGDEITGVIDFEWALAGAPLADFVPEETWEGQCAGSREWVYVGYQSVRPLEAGHSQKLKVYKLLLALETVVDMARAGDGAGTEAQRQRLAMLMGEL